MDQTTLRKLQRAYIASFPEKKERLQALTEAACDGDEPRELNRLVHSLAGSGASFGFPAISRYCHAMERRITALGANVAPAAAELNEWTQRLQDLLDRLADDPTWEGAATPPVEVEASGGLEVPSEPGEAILLVDDDPDIQTLVEAILGEHGYVVRTAGSGREAFEQVSSSVPDLILLDVELPDSSGLDILHRLRELPGLDLVPIFFLSSRSDERDVVEGLRRGSDDYITKPFSSTELLARVAARLERQRILSQLSLTDPLTGLANRRAFDQRLKQEVARLRRSGDGLAVLLLDLDEFKLVNDGFGHAAGDRVLVEVAARIANAIRSYDLAARYGGEEMVVLMTGIGADVAEAVGNRILERLRSRPVVLDDGRSVPITASAGLATCTTEQWCDGAEILAQADAALYRAKEAGKDRLEIAS